MSRLCPRCGKPIRSARGCVECGPVADGAAFGNGGLPPAPATTWDVPRLETAFERRFRQLAVPIALLIAWAAVQSGFARMLLRTVFSMWIHELGHAAAAWLCGRWAFPGPWFTPVGGSRSWLVMLLVVAAAVYGVIRLWPSRKLWALVVALLVPAEMLCALGLSPRRQDTFILWAGDGGCMLIGTLMMLSLYARASSSLRKGWLRWGFLVIGAAAFVDAFATWWAARADRDAVPFGENEGSGLSDPTVLVFQHGISLDGLVTSYLWTGALCLAVLAVAYALGLRRKVIAPTESEG
jgi:hypothetical protein